MKLGFKLYFKDKTVFVPLDSLKGESSARETVYKTELNGVSVRWSFRKLDKGVVVDLSVSSGEPLGLKRIDSLVFDSPTPSKTDRIRFFGNGLSKSENRYFCELKDNAERCSDCTGLFSDLTAKGIVLAMLAPFTNIVGAVQKRKRNLSYRPHRPRCRKIHSRLI